MLIAMQRHPRNYHPLHSFASTALCTGKISFRNFQQICYSGVWGHSGQFAAFWAILGHLGNSREELIKLVDYTIHATTGFWDSLKFLLGVDQESLLFRQFSSGFCPQRSLCAVDTLVIILHAAAKDPHHCFSMPRFILQIIPKKRISAEIMLFFIKPLIFFTINKYPIFTITYYILS